MSAPEVAIFFQACPSVCFFPYFFRQPRLLKYTRVQKHQLPLSVSLSPSAIPLGPERMSCNFSTAPQQRAKRWSAQRKCQVVLTEDVERMWRIAKPLSAKGKLTWLEAEWVTKKIGPRIFPFWWWPFYGTGQVASVPRPPHRARHNAKLGPIGTRPAGRCFFPLLALAREFPGFVDPYVKQKSRWVHSLMFDYVGKVCWETRLICWSTIDS